MDCLLHWNIPDRGAVPWPGPRTSSKFWHLTMNGISKKCEWCFIVLYQISNCGQFKISNVCCGWIYGIVCRYRTQNANEILPSIVELECFHYAYLCVLCLD
jgi:hypothetical protein